MDIFCTGGVGGSNSFHSYWGVFPDITKPILYDENSKQSQNLPTKNDHFAPNEFLLSRTGFPKNGYLRFFWRNVESRWYAV